MKKSITLSYSNGDNYYPNDKDLLAIVTMLNTKAFKLRWGTKKWKELNLLSNKMFNLYLDIIH